LTIQPKKPATNEPAWFNDKFRLIGRFKKRGAKRTIPGLPQSSGNAKGRKEMFVEIVLKINLPITKDY
jgi:hypothetical protein